LGIDTVKSEDFEKFLRIRKGLGDKTIETYVIHFKKFLRFLNGRDATKEIVSSSKVMVNLA
jgi:site-specific recombinase XerD